MLDRRSAIAAGLAVGSRLRDGGSGVRIGEVRGWALLQVAGFRGGMALVEQAIAAACGVAPSIYMGQTARSGDLALLRTGPEQIWIIGPGEALAAEGAIRANTSSETAVVLSLSHSRTRMFIEGPKAREVLAKEITVDLDPAVFPVDQFALTGFDHTPVLLHRTGPDRYELYVMRTFAQTVWERLADAALEYGYEAVT